MNSTPPSRLAPEPALLPLHQHRYLSPSEVAGWLNVSERHLAHLRHSGRGPPYYSLGYRTVRYIKAEVEAWLDSMTASRGEKRKQVSA